VHLTAVSVVAVAQPAAHYQISSASRANQSNWGGKPEQFAAPGLLFRVSVTGVLNSVIAIVGTGCGTLFDLNLGSYVGHESSILSERGDAGIARIGKA
jgi:hypothetical protein